MEFKNKNEEKSLAASKLAGIFKKLELKDAGEYYKRIRDFEIKIIEFDAVSNDIEEIEIRIERIDEFIKNSITEENKNTDMEDTNESKAAQSLLHQISLDYSRKENEMDLAKENLKYFCQSEGLLDLLEEILSCYESKEGIFTEYIESNHMEISREQDSLFIKLKENEMAIGFLNELDNEIIKKEEEITNQEVKKKKMDDLSFSIGTAISVFKDAGEELKNGTMPMLLNNFSRVVEQFTEGKYKSLSLDDSFEIKAIEPYLENIVDVTALSGGTLEQIYLALRLSFAESALGGKEKLPLILDEVFAYYDDSRTIQSCRFLHELSLDRQIILFTCKAREMEIAKEIFGENLQYIELNN